MVNIFDKIIFADAVKNSAAKQHRVLQNLDN